MAWATRLAKQKIFQQDKVTGEYTKDPNQCFDIVYSEVGKEDAEKIWETERDNNKNKSSVLE